MTSRTLDITNPQDRALGLRIAALAKIDPSNVLADRFTIHRNHITYHEIQNDSGGLPLINHHYRLVTKQRIIRNPLPSSAWKETR